MSTLGWILIGAGALMMLISGVFAWVLARAAALGDEIQRMQRLAQLGQDARNGVEILGYPEDPR